MASTPALSCSPHTWTDCVSNFCCLGDDALKVIIAYLLIEATRLSGSTAKEVIAYASTESTLPNAFTEHDYLLAVACLAASLANNSHSGMDIFRDAQQAGYNTLSPDQIRIIFILAFCLLTANNQD